MKYEELLHAYNSISSSGDNIYLPRIRPNASERQTGFSQI